jgi:spore coat protein JB
MHDLNLYLDVFPNDKEILSKFMEYENMYNDLLENYEKKYGPINVNNTLGTTPFNWVNTSFPWEAK